MTENQSHTALLVVDNQLGFRHPTHWGPSRSNPNYESNLASLLPAFRNAQPKPFIIHVQHLSLSETSILYSSNPQSQLEPSSTPLPDEPLVTKHVNSAFIGTNLESMLRDREIRTLYLVGLTTDHCVSTTTRMAGNLGVTAWVDGDGKAQKGDVVLVADATACWKKPDGEWDAEVVHAVHVESLKEFATVMSTEEVLANLRR